MKYAGQTIRVVAAEIARRGRYLITQRAPKAVLPLLWEFPGGRVEHGESDVEAVSREIREKFGIEPQVGELTLDVTHTYPQYTVNLRVYRCSVDVDDFPEADVHDWRWVAPHEFEDYDFPGADQQTIDQLVRAM